MLPVLCFQPICVPRRPGIARECRTHKPLTAYLHSDVIPQNSGAQQHRIQQGNPLAFPCSRRFQNRSAGSRSCHPQGAQVGQPHRPGGRRVANHLPDAGPLPLPLLDQFNDAGCVEGIQMLRHLAARLHDLVIRQGLCSGELIASVSLSHTLCQICRGGRQGATQCTSHWSKEQPPGNEVIVYCG